MSFVSFDIETTGTLSHIDQIVEIGAVCFSEGKVKDTFSQLISIDMPMPKQASSINGITDDMLKNQPPIEKVLPDFAEFCSDHLLVAHNAPFDFQFLLRSIEEHQSPAPRGLVFDSCQLARKSFFGLANYKLSTLCDYLKIPSESFHRAELDALYCGRLFLHILKKNAFSIGDIDKMIHLSGRKPLKFPEIQFEGQMDLF